MVDLDVFDCFNFFVGVPDSQLKPLSDYLLYTYGISDKHIVAANEGNAVALAAGYHLATGRIPVVYMQNSGIGNAVNPITSLLNDKIYGIPCLFIIGWRGQPNVKDEPQHIFQGQITEIVLKDLDIETMIISKDTTNEEVKGQLYSWQNRISLGKSVAFLVKEGALRTERKLTFKNNNELLREEIIKYIVDAAQGDVIVSTTGKTSRELFEIREKNGQTHSRDFLTVGSMGHCSSIAYSIAIQQKERRVWCLDGDGSVLMHMGAMAIIGANKPSNLVHIVINNAAHESVGGIPTVAQDIDLCKIAQGCGYCSIMRANSYVELEQVLKQAKNVNQITFIEVPAAIASRNDLGRPTIAAKRNKEHFMDYLINNSSFR